MGQSNIYLYKEFTNNSHPLFSWNFIIEGLQEILPQFEEKYPGQNLLYKMKAYISVFRHLRPYIVFSETWGKLVVNFNLDFLNIVFEDSFDPDEDLSLNITDELDFTVQIKYDLLNVNYGDFKALSLDENVNELNAPYDDLVSLVSKNRDAYLNKFIKGLKMKLSLPF